MGLKIGSTNGYTRSIMAHVLPVAAHPSANRHRSVPRGPLAAEMDVHIGWLLYWLQTT